MKFLSGQEASAKLAAEAANVMIYGPPGTGKTSDAVAAFGGKAAVICCSPGALKPLLARGLPIPTYNEDPVTTWAEMCEALAFVAKHKADFTAVILDDFSVWMANAYTEIEKGYKGNNRFQIPLIMRDQLKTIRDGLRWLGLHSVMICHAAPPTHNETTGEILAKGGPIFSPKTAGALYVPVIDTILRVDTLTVGMQNHRVYFTGGTEWPATLGMQPKDLWLWWAKNREGCNQAVIPADLGAFLRGRVPPYGGI